MALSDYSVFVDENGNNVFGGDAEALQKVVDRLRAKVWELHEKAGNTKYPTFQYQMQDLQQLGRLAEAANLVASAAVRLRCLNCVNVK